MGWAKIGEKITPITIKNMGIIRQGLVTIPSGREDLIPKDYEIIDKRFSKC